MPDGGAEAELLAIRDLHAFYGESHTLHGVEFAVNRGEVVTLLGRNGAGKTTTLKAIMGIIDSRRGAIRFDGHNLISLKPFEIGRLGIAYCPEERGIFASLNVEENILLPPVVKTGGMTMQDLYRLFPNLHDRRASQGSKLSGGEQQMLAIARILRTGAKLLLLDEPTEGLAPTIIEQIRKLIHELKDKGFTILLVEQNFHFASTVADRFYVMEDGHIVDEIANSQLGASMGRFDRYLGV